PLQSTSHTHYKPVSHLENMSPTMFAWQSPASSLGLDADLVFNPSAPFPPIPKKGPSTLVKVLAASLNPAELKASRAPLLAPIIKKPFTPGFDFVGTVVESSAGF